MKKNKFVIVSTNPRRAVRDEVINGIPYLVRADGSARTIYGGTEFACEADLIRYCSTMMRHD